MRHKRKKIRFYAGDVTRHARPRPVWLIPMLIVVAALALALIVGAVLGGSAGDSHRDRKAPVSLTDFGGTKAAEGHYAELFPLSAHGFSLGATTVDELEELVDELPEGNGLAFVLNDTQKKLYFSTELFDKTDISFSQKNDISTGSLLKMADRKERYAVGFFNSTALREADPQLALLSMAEELALLSELAEAGFRELVILGLPSEEEHLATVNSYMREAKRVCGDTILGLSLPTDGAVISAMLAATEGYADSYYLDARPLSDDALNTATETLAYYLTAYAMRVVLSDQGEATDAYLSHYGIKNYVIMTE